MISQPQGPPFTLLGIHSFGAFPCGMEGFPSVYTSVAEYRDWIMQNLRA
ncbi:UNVERIFIED_CONTAM: hypothetical protein GTU68_003164 [Idotea baltica]|nr:hypothetical protein [Idotea baltica]